MKGSFKMETINQIVKDLEFFGFSNEEIESWLNGKIKLNELLLQKEGFGFSKN